MRELKLDSKFAFDLVPIQEIQYGGPFVRPDQPNMNPADCTTSKKMAEVLEVPKCSANISYRSPIAGHVYQWNSRENGRKRSRARYAIWWLWQSERDLKIQCDDIPQVVHLCRSPIEYGDIYKGAVHN